MTDVACLVIVDVLSFTTSVSVAVESGSRVYPYRWRDETAERFAEQVDARLAVSRHEISATSPWSLSPASLRDAPHTGRLVLPSPNGSTIAAGAGEATVVAGCLRNARSVGQWIAAQGYGTVEAPVLVIASGERWPDGTLRPALEDLLGAGAVISALNDELRGTCSPEAATATAAFAGTPDVASVVAASSSGRELTAEGFADDVAIATELDGSTIIPVVVEGSFTTVT